MIPRPFIATAAALSHIAAATGQLCLALWLASFWPEILPRASLFMGAAILIAAGLAGFSAWLAIDATRAAFRALAGE